MENFKPRVYVVKKKDGTISIFAVTITPNLCFETGAAEEGVPEGYIVIEHVLPVKLYVEYTSAGICGLAQKPVFHLLDRIIPAENQTQIVAFIMMDGKVVGFNSEPIPEDVRAEISETGEGLLPFPVGTREGVAFFVKEKQEAALALTAVERQPPSERDRVLIKVKISDVDIYSIRLNEDEKTLITSPGDREIRLKLKPDVHILDYIVRGPMNSEYKIEITGDKKRLQNHKELVFSDITLSDGEGGGTCKLVIK